MGWRRLCFWGTGVAAAWMMGCGLGGPVVAQTTLDAPAMRHLIDSGHAEQVLRQTATLKAAGKPSGIAGLSEIEGLAYYALGRMKEADEAFAEALAQDPADAEAKGMRALTLVRLGRPAEAIPLLEAVQGRAGAADEKADPHYVLGLCYIDVRRYDDARHAFAAQFGMAPDGAPAYLLGARMLLRREYLPVAQQFAEKAVALEPQLPLAHALLGEVALAGNHLDVAIAEFERERAANPLEPSVYDRLGDAYGRAGQYEHALASLQEAVLLEPQATGPYILLGKVLLKRGDAVGAATYLQRAVTMDAGNYMSHSLLGQAYRTMGRTEAASQQMETAQRLQAASEPKLESLH